MKIIIEYQDQFGKWHRFQEKHNAAALLKQDEAATSAAGALDADSKGSDATAE